MAGKTWIMCCLRWQVRFKSYVAFGTFAGIHPRLSVTKAQPPAQEGGGRTVTELARELTLEGISISTVAGAFKVHPATIYRCLEETPAL